MLEGLEKEAREARKACGLIRSRCRRGSGGREPSSFICIYEACNPFLWQAVTNRGTERGTGLTFYFTETSKPLSVSPPC